MYKLQPEEIVAKLKKNNSVEQARVIAEERLEVYKQANHEKMVELYTQVINKL